MAKRGTPDHPKTLKLARMLGIEPWAATGLLECFWHWCSRYAITGEVESDPQDVADGIRYGGDAQKMWDALVECRWVDCIDGRYFVHDVSQHADNTWKANLKRCCKEFATPSQHSKEEVTTKSQLSDEPPKPEPEPTPKGVLRQAKAPDPLLAKVIDHLNETAGRRFTYDGGQAKYARGRLRDGATVEQLNLVTDHRTALWKNDPKMRDFLRPETLFSNDHWESYLQSAEDWAKNGRALSNGKPSQSINYRGAYD